MDDVEKQLNAFEKEFYRSIIENEDYSLDIINDPNLNMNEHLDLFLDDKYTADYSIKKDVQINNALKKYQDIDTLLINGFNTKLPTSVSVMLHDMEYLTSLVVGSYLGKNEYKYIENFINLESLVIHMYSTTDIDFTKLVSLKKCRIYINASQNDEERIKVSKDYIKKLQDEGSSTEFELIVD